MLVRENRMSLLESCLKFINTRVHLDLADYKDDIFSPENMRCRHC